jgi:hypothetical protein
MSNQQKLQGPSLTPEDIAAYVAPRIAHLQSQLDALFSEPVTEFEYHVASQYRSANLRRSGIPVSLCAPLNDEDVIFLARGVDIDRLSREIGWLETLPERWARWHETCGGES